MEKKNQKMKLPTIDDLFTTQEERDEKKLEKIVNLSIKDIDEFPNHPFNVNIDEEFLSSIKECVFIPYSSPE